MSEFVEKNDIGIDNPHPDATSMAQALLFIEVAMWDQQTK